MCTSNTLSRCCRLSMVFIMSVMQETISSPLLTCSIAHTCWSTCVCVFVYVHVYVAQVCMYVCMGMLQACVCVCVCAYMHDDVTVTACNDSLISRPFDPSVCHLQSVSVLQETNAGVRMCAMVCMFGCVHTYWYDEVYVVLHQ